LKKRAPRAKNSAAKRGGEARQLDDILMELVGEKVVIDLRSEYVCLGTLARIDEHSLGLKDADIHDLRDTDTGRENYVAASIATGIKRNRKFVVIMRSDVVAVARLGDVVDV
jgi:hypothetical protein